MWSPVGGREGSGKGEREGGQRGLCHCGLGRTREPVAKANWGKSSTLRGAKW